MGQQGAKERESRGIKKGREESNGAARCEREGEQGDTGRKKGRVKWGQPGVKERESRGIKEGRRGRVKWGIKE
jgi:hypothetical protein